MTQTIEEYCLHQLGAYESRPFGRYPICYRVMGKIFAQFNPEDTFYKITLKCDPDKAEQYRQLYPGVIVRGYHCPPIQQPYWNTIDLLAFTDKELLLQMIDEAYEAVLGKLSKKARKQLSAFTEIDFKYTDGNDPEFALLCNQLDQTLDQSVGGNLHRRQYEQYNQRETIHDVILAYKEGIPIACGAFKMYDEEHAELKRLYTDATVRNMGLGAEIIRRLEAMAKIKGYKWCILETGLSLEAACHLYKKAGYKIITNYGPYADMPDSICMKRKI